MSDKKIFLINNAEKLNINAQNAILKILEEPPKYIHIFLIAKDMDNILPTIKSRVKKIYVYDLEERLKHKAKQNIEDIEFNKKIKELENFFNDILSFSKYRFYNKYKNIFTKDEYKQELEYLEEIYNKKINEDIGNNISNIYEIFLETNKKIQTNCNYEMLIDNFLFKAWESVRQDENN